MRAELANIMVKEKKANDTKVVDLATGEIIDRPKTIVLTQMNYKRFNTYIGETNKGKDMCVPDQTLSLREILDRHSKGFEIEGRTAIFTDEQNTMGINPMTLDLIDLQRLSILNKQDIEKYRNKAIEEKAQIAKKAQQERQKMQDEASDEAYKRIVERYGATDLKSVKNLPEGH